MSLMRHSSVSGESGEVSNPLRLIEAICLHGSNAQRMPFHEAIVNPLVIDGGRSGSPISAVVIENELPANGRDGS